MLNEPVEVINKRLLETFGRFDTTDLPKYRVVWSTDQFEKRWTNYTKEGFLLESPTVVELPKYRQYKPDKWVLEVCIGVPPFVETDLVEKYSYEPFFFFEDKDEFPLPPVWRVCEYAIVMTQIQAAKAVGKEFYYGPYHGLNEEEQKEFYEQELKEIGEEFFGNETDISTALQHKEGIIVP